MKKTMFFFAIVSVTLLLAACGGNDEAKKGKNSENEKIETLYEGDNFSVKKEGSWKKTKETSSTVRFEKEDVKTIITPVPRENQNETIRKELKISSGDIEILKEKVDILSFKSKKEESIRSDIYIVDGKDAKYVVVFQMPSKTFDEKNIEEFLDMLIIEEL